MGEFFFNVVLASNYSSTTHTVINPLLLTQYHLYDGSKTFFFIEPTPKNLKIFSKWATNATTGKRGKKSAFLPDLILSSGGKVCEVVLRKGQTLFIPSGWIHAVHTPVDSLVFGGNFVHRHSLEMQLTIHRLEGQMRVGNDFRFPNYQRLMWYAARDFLAECNEVLRKGRRRDRLNKNNDPIDEHRQCQAQKILCAAYPPHVLSGYNVLAKELERWSVSKEKHTIQQYPENMNVVAVSTELGNMMKPCVAYLDDKNGKKKLDGKHKQGSAQH